MNEVGSNPPRIAREVLILRREEVQVVSVPISHHSRRSVEVREIHSLLHLREVLREVKHENCQAHQSQQISHRRNHNMTQEMVCIVYALPMAAHHNTK